MGDVAKLPKWAREEIESLRLRAQHLKNERDALCSKEPTRIMWGWKFQDEPFGFLPETESITFFVKTDTQDRHEIRVRLSSNDAGIQVNASGCIATFHESGNCCTIKIVR